MKKILGMILACALLCTAAISLTACHKADEGKSVSDSGQSSRSAQSDSEFTDKDITLTVLGVGDVSLGMTKEEVEEALGKPTTTKDDKTRGEVWYYQDVNFDVSFQDDAAAVMTAGALDDKTVMLKSRKLYLDDTFENTIAAFYDNGKKRHIDFISEIKKRKLGNELLKEYGGVDAYYLYGDLFDDSVTACGYVEHIAAEENASEYQRIVYTYVHLDEGSSVAGHYYTLSFDTYTDPDSPTRTGSLYLGCEYRAE